jgi:hypothetical protein
MEGRMPVRRCEACGRSFEQGMGRPARFCPEHREGGGRYGGEHRKLAAATKDSAWGTPCTRCGRTMLPGQEIHLDHADGGGPADYRGWSHAYCNVAAGNRMRGRVNGTPVTNGLSVTGPVIPPGPNPDIPHRPDCRCGAMQTSRCW